MATEREASRDGSRRILVPSRLAGQDDAAVRRELVSGVRVLRLGPDTELAVEVRGVLSRGRLEVPSRDADEMVRRLFDEPKAQPVHPLLDPAAWDTLGALLDAIEESAAARDYLTKSERRRRLLQFLAPYLPPAPAVGS